MEDKKIVALFFSRDEAALSECEKKYGRYCMAIAERILGSEEDAKETVNDIYLRAWSEIPPKVPDDLCAYLGMICRSRALDVRKSQTRQKRGGEISDAALDELIECLPAEDENPVDAIALRDAMNSFIETLSARERVIFVQRYYHLYGIKEIAADNDLRESAVKMRLQRLRQKLAEHLRINGFIL